MMPYAAKTRVLDRVSVFLGPLVGFLAGCAIVLAMSLHAGG